MVSQILLLDQPRSGGHLLERILSKQSSSQLLYNKLGPARGVQVEWLLKDNWAEGMSEETRRSFESKVKAATESWQTELSKASDEEKILMVQDHIFSAADPTIVLKVIEAASTNTEVLKPGSNFTLIPDDLLLKPGTIPILTIRDPRLTVPSTYRVLDDMGLPHGSGRPNFLTSTTVFWQRMIYEFFVSHGIQPVIVDADDVMTRPDFARALAARLGLDPNQLHLSWAPVDEQERTEMHPALYTSKKYLLESHGIDASRAARNMDMEKEVAKWDAEFKEDAGLVREMAAMAKEEYDWMHQHRFKD